MLAVDWIKWVKWLSRRHELGVMVLGIESVRRNIAFAGTGVWEWSNSNTSTGAAGGSPLAKVDVESALRRSARGAVNLTCGVQAVCSVTLPSAEGTATGRRSADLGADLVAAVYGVALSLGTRPGEAVQQVLRYVRLSGEGGAK